MEVFMNLDEFLEDVLDENKLASTTENVTDKKTETETKEDVEK